MNSLLLPYQLGPLSLAHRIVMPPMVRGRAESDGTPGDMMRDYYVQRSSPGGFIIAEAAAISEIGIGYKGGPLIYTEEHMLGWKRVVDAVHDKGAYIFLQLWHAGRRSPPELRREGTQAVAPSAVADLGAPELGFRSFPMPRELGIDEIRAITEEYRQATILAKQAGFDGVEIHAAHGYLPDQFLADNTNLREDEYGGSIENRSRFLMDLVQVTSEIYGKDRVGVRLSPSNRLGNIIPADPERLFRYLAQRLNDEQILYLHIVEPRVQGSFTLNDDAAPVATKSLREVFRRPLISAGGFSAESGAATIDAGIADLIAYGRFFIPNPDLPERFRNNWPLTPYERSSFYQGDHRGYVDYDNYQYA